MCPYLMRAPGLKLAFDEGHIAETFDYFPMRDGMPPFLSFRKYCHHLTVIFASAKMPFYGPLLILHISPYEGHIFAFDLVIEKLLSEPGLSQLIFSDEHDTGCVFIYSVKESRSNT